MRVLQIIHDFVPETVAGAELIAYNLSIGLTKKGHEVFVFCRGWKLDGERYAIRDEVLDGLHVRRIDFGLGGRPHQVQRHDPKIDQALRDYIAEIKPDLIHIHQFIYLSTDIFAIAKSTGVPLMASMHDFIFRCPAINRLYHDDSLCDRHPDLECLSCFWPDTLSRKRKVIPWRQLNPMLISAYRSGHKEVIPKQPRQILDSLSTWATEVREGMLLVDATHSPSDFVRDMLIDFGLSPDKVFTIGNGIQYKPGAALPKKPSSILRFGTIGKSKIKGTHVAISAMKHLPYDAAELRVYGKYTGKYKEELEALAEGSNVKFMGLFQQSDIAEIFSEIDVLIVPSIWYENYPTVIREGFANNSPVMVSDIGSMIESVVDGVDGFRFIVGDSVDLAQKMQRFIDDPSLVESFRANIKVQPTDETFSNEIERIYKQLMEGKPAAG